MRHTHGDILTPEIRKVFANELLLVRKKLIHNKKYPISEEGLFWLRIGLDTAFRRCDWLLRNGVQ